MNLIKTLLMNRGWKDAYLHLPWRNATTAPLRDVPILLLIYWWTEETIHNIYVK